MYALQLENVRNHDGDGESSEFETIKVFDDIPSDLVAIRRNYLLVVYGEDYERVTVYKDESHCGGALLEAVDQEGVITRLWLQFISP